MIVLQIQTEDTMDRTVVHSCCYETGIFFSCDIISLRFCCPPISSLNKTKHTGTSQICLTFLDRVFSLYDLKKKASYLNSKSLSTDSFFNFSTYTPKNTPQTEEVWFHPFLPHLGNCLL